jgi:peroxiredoxin
LGDAEYKSNPKFISAMAEGKQLSRKQQYDFAADAFKKACKIAEQKDEACLTELYTAQMKGSNFKDAAATASALEAIAANPNEKASAEVKRGHALLYQAGDKNKPDLLKASDAALKAAIADDPKNGGPCNAELPHMKKIAKEFAGQPLVIISVSWDSDEQKWRDFINKNEMTWVQYRDADHHLSNLFGINAIPHYFTIDSDGVLTAEMLGEGSNVEGKLKKLVAKAKVATPAPTTQVGN